MDNQSVAGDGKEFLRFTRTMIVVAEYYNRQISDAVILLYWHGLNKYSIEQIETTAQRHMAHPDTGMYFPKIADFVRLLEGGSKDNAAIAWSKVESTVKHIGTYRDVVFDDPIIHAVIRDMGGWIQLGDKTLDEWPFIGNDFKARYAAYRSQGLSVRYPASLRGRVNGEKWGSGFALDAPELHGDQSACLLVARGGDGSAAILESLGIADAKTLPSPGQPERAVNEILIEEECHVS